MDDNDEVENYMGEYEDGHWKWDDDEGILVFIRDIILKPEALPLTATVLGTLDFSEDLDVFEQQRFKRRFQRKTGDGDVVLLQDIKDLVLFTAPKPLVTSSIINVLHLPAMERFLRSLIFYCQYFIQISDEMGKRNLELVDKIRTDNCDAIELEYKENLVDLRILVAKEYSLLIQGEDDYTKYHHMGSQKKHKSFMRNELLFIETLWRFCIQIVWLAVGRTSHNELEIEIHRLIKSHRFNLVDRGTNSNQALSNEEEKVLFGDCLKLGRGKMVTFSPLINELLCDRKIDHRLLGLGVIKYSRLCARLRYLEHVLITPEKHLKDLGVSLGILGMDRSRFDIILKEIKTCATTVSSGDLVRASIISNRRTSTKSTKSSASMNTKLLIPIQIPEKDKLDLDIVPDHFPHKLHSKRKCSDTQRRKWLIYFKRLHSATKSNASKRRHF